jgi:putative FmdB family regulatory protein
MPVYEFYCRKCNTIFNFFSKSVNTDKVPSCPRCKNTRLKRRMSVFSKISRGKEAPEEDNLPPIDEVRMEKAMSMLAREAEGMDEEDPRQAAKLMRKLSDAAGIELGPMMEEALSRMEAGEDPEKMEEEMGDLLENDDLFTLSRKALKGRRTARPKVDETLYDL